ncbi:uncharacterized protein LOC111384075 [Olea europaea var. sylvestris]|uniref:Uncharacterized protein n=1 Tax=Olea europaea subsp. europaea TaxID=158383 RepID=A0A8S0UXZ4_OLEEU|nr:uncharacterized protein LOC111384075 [Olea europaea var. sylvestris]CAA3025624.1 Hypothetical predicted protein [Olea europaea subsp. europaea]
MSNKAPIFPIPEPQHFTDYGFDPQVDHFQVLEEAKNYKESLTSIDTLHFKLQKPISTDEHSKKKIKKSKMRWWRNALLFFKWNKWAPRSGGATTASGSCNNINHHRIGSISGPVYITESRSGSSTPYRITTNRPSSGPLAESLSKDEVEIPYLSLRELNMEHRHRISTSAMPIYLVT